MSVLPQFNWERESPKLKRSLYTRESSRTRARGPMLESKISNFQTQSEI
jgi:hypothetical protein